MGQETMANKDPKLELQGKKWVCENQTGKKDLQINAELGQTVYIYNIKDCVIQIKGKLASLAIDKAVKSGIVWEQCVGSAEVVNSSSIQIQGKAPSFAIDKSSGVTLFLTKDDTESSIFTSLASEVNINVLAENEDPKETNVPSQFVTTFQNGNWVTAPVEHVGV